MQGRFGPSAWTGVTQDMYLQMKEGIFDLSSISQQPMLVAEYTSAYKVLEKKEMKESTMPL